MKHIFLFSLIAFIFLFSIDSKCYIVTELGQGWVITGGHNVQGKVVGNNLYINSNSPQNATRAWVTCEGDGYCMRITDGYVDIDLSPLGSLNLVLNSTPPNPLGLNDKMAERQLLNFNNLQKNLQGLNNIINDIELEQ